VKLHEHYHNGFLRPAFPKLVKGLANFGHPIQYYPSLSSYTPLWWYAFHLQCWGCLSFTLHQGSWFFVDVQDC
jgi:hypothetical protein